MPVEPEVWWPKHLPRLCIPWEGNLDDLPLRWKTSGAFRLLDNGLLSVVTPNRVAIAFPSLTNIAQDLAGGFYTPYRAVWEATYYQEAQQP